MKLSIDLSLSLFLLSSAAPIFSAPVPHQATSACTSATSCKPSYRTLVALWSTTSTSKTAPQSSWIPNDAAIEGHKLLQSPAAIKTAIEHRVPESWLAGLDRQPLPESESSRSTNSMLAKLQAEDAQRFGFAALKNHLKGAGGGCHRAAKYTYIVGYTYVKKDYKDMLVVGLVICFLLAVIMVEMFETVVESARQALGLPGSIRVEDAEQLPEYSECADSELDRSSATHLCSCSQQAEMAEEKQ